MSKMRRLAALSALFWLSCAGEAPDQGSSAPGSVQEAGTSAPVQPVEPARAPGASESAQDASVAQVEPAKPAPSNAGSATPSSSGTGTPAEPARALDRDASFDWPQTKPSDKRRCQGGKYDGKWNCNTLGVLPFEGKVNLQFVESMDGEFLELSDARLSGLVGEGEFRFDAQLTGRLDCTTLKFSAKVSMGNYDRLEFDGSYVPVGMFDGTLTGALEPESRQIKGEWSLLADVLVDCVGPWSASFTP